jgi:hypothetical protein
VSTTNDYRIKAAHFGDTPNIRKCIYPNGLPSQQAKPGWPSATHKYAYIA